MPGKYSAYDPVNLLTTYQRRKAEETAAAEERERYQLLNPDKPEQPRTRDEAITRTFVQKGIMRSNALDEKRERSNEAHLAYNLGQSPLGMVGPNEGYEFEGAEGDMAEAQRQRFLGEDSDAAFIQPELGVNPEADSGDTWQTPRNIANFLFSDEMGLLGIKWTEDGATWAWDNFRTQLSEHPYSTTLTLASYMVPIGAAWMKGARVAKRAAELAETTGDVSSLKIRGLWGTKGGTDAANMGDTLDAMKALGPRVRFDDHAKLVKQLAFSPEAADGRKFFTPARLKRIRDAATDEDIANIVPEKEFRRMLIGDMHMERYLKLKSMAKAGEAMNPIRKAELRMWETFGNRYFNNLTDMSREQIESMDEWFQKAGIGRWLSSAPVALNKVQQNTMYKFWAGKESYDNLAREVGDDAALWADGLRGQWTDLFKAQADEGFIDQETALMFNREFGGFHLPAILEGTPGFEDLSRTERTLIGIPGKPGRAATVRATQRTDPAKAFSSVTLKRRGKRTTWAKTEEDLDQIITDPRSLTVGGFIKDNVLFQVHRGFRDFMVEHVKKNPKVSQYVMDADQYDNLPEYAKKYWLNIDELDKVSPDLGVRMERMVRTSLEKEGLEGVDRLPVVSRDVAEQFFGKERSAFQGAGTFSKMFELYTAVHKTARTALNPPTHMSNLIGNFMFLGMAGMNPFGRQALDDGRMFTRAFSKLANKANANPDLALADLLDKDILANIFGKSRYIVDDLGDKIDLADIFSTESMKQLVEAQAFESVEGLQHVHKILDQLDAAEKGGFGEKVLANAARTIAGFGEVRGIKGTLDKMSAAYLGEDMVPKMMYAAHLLRKGYGTDAVVKEVGRRLPQYQTVGNLQQYTRRIILPWITFPTEAARIIKNNMMDSPVSMMAWMKAPSIAQSITYGADISPDYEETEKMIENAPGWAERYQTVFLEEEAAPTFLGAMGGATMGAAVGGAVGGARGAAVGGIAGAAGGAFLGKQSPTRERLTQSDLSSMARAWSMDFLPTSAIMFSSTHPHEWEKIDPFNDVPTPGGEVMGTMKDLSPIEPFAIAMPLLELASGRGSFGREITSKSGWEMANKMALGLYGMVMPPMVQKYGMRMEGPGGAILPMADTFDANGGQMTLPKATTATFFGLGMAGLTALGTRKLGATTAQTVAAGLTAGIPGAMAGAEINTRRLMTDLGVMKDPYTNEPGDWTQDFFFNTFMGVNKSWRTSPLTGLANEERRRRRFADIRSSSLKSFMDALRNGSESSAIAATAEAYKTFQLQWADTERADVEYLKWLERQMKNLVKTPQMRGISEDELIFGINAVKDMLRTDKSRVLRQKLSVMETELKMRRMSKAGNVKFVK